MAFSYFYSLSGYHAFYYPVRVSSLDFSEATVKPEVLRVGDNQVTKLQGGVLSTRTQILLLKLKYRTIQLYTHTRLVMHRS